MPTTFEVRACVGHAEHLTAGMLGCRYYANSNHLSRIYPCCTSTAQTLIRACRKQQRASGRASLQVPALVVKRAESLVRELDFVPPLKRAILWCRSHNISSLCLMRLSDKSNGIKASLYTSCLINLLYRCHPTTLTGVQVSHCTQGRESTPQVGLHSGVLCIARADGRNALI